MGGILDSLLKCVGKCSTIITETSLRIEVTGMDDVLLNLTIITFLACVAISIVLSTVRSINEKKYRELESEVLKKLGFTNWDIVQYYDDEVFVKSRRALETYDDIKYFKENKGKLAFAKYILARKNDVENILSAFLENNDYKEH